MSVSAQGWGGLPGSQRNCNSCLEILALLPRPYGNPDVYTIIMWGSWRFEVSSERPSPKECSRTPLFSLEMLLEVRCCPHLWSRERKSEKEKEGTSAGRPGARTLRQELTPGLWEDGGEPRVWDPLQTLNFPFLQRRPKFTPSLISEEGKVEVSPGSCPWLGTPRFTTSLILK